MRFSIRNYRSEDFPTLLGIDRSCFSPEIAYSAYELKTYIQRKSAFTFVAVRTLGAEAYPSPDPPEKGHILGFIVGEHSRGAGHIITIDVVPEARRQKLGSSLLELAEKQLRLSKCSVVRLETAVDNTSALSFYQRHGYHVLQTIPRYYSSGVDALLLEKDLLSPPSGR